MSGERSAGANVTVVVLFAIFYDARRRSDGHDAGRGERGAQCAVDRRAAWLTLADDEMDLLRLACARRTDWWTEADVTVQTCWDADRLDLPRAGVRVRPERLCTAAARDPAVIAWSAERSRAGFAPEFVAGWRGEGA